MGRFQMKVNRMVCEKSTFMLLFSWCTVCRSCWSFCSSMRRLSASSLLSSISLFISSNLKGEKKENVKREKRGVERKAYLYFYFIKIKVLPFSC